VVGGQQRDRLDLVGQARTPASITDRRIKRGGEGGAKVGEQQSERASLSLSVWWVGKDHHSPLRRPPPARRYLGPPAKRRKDGHTSVRSPASELRNHQASCVKQRRPASATGMVTLGRCGVRSVLTCSSA